MKLRTISSDFILCTYISFCLAFAVEECRNGWPCSVIIILVLLRAHDLAAKISPGSMPGESMDHSRKTSSQLLLSHIGRHDREREI